MADADDLDASIDAWVSAQLDASPDWDQEKWETLGKILDVEFSVPGDSRVYNFAKPVTEISVDSEAA
ncbi:hypothetical protein [Kitasatospora sp. MBT66]|uniref:hypothetical protein n=1 Tax=unclassified Kitasatospora TaxID=2633591 RepID=UPI0005B8C76B|nr:hypothetical protein [Kitasatospora sp. MBT66]